MTLAAGFASSGTELSAAVFVLFFGAFLLELDEGLLCPLCFGASALTAIFGDKLVSFLVPGVEGDPLDNPQPVPVL